MWTRIGETDRPKVIPNRPFLKAGRSAPVGGQASFAKGLVSGGVAPKAATQAATFASSKSRTASAISRVVATLPAANFMF